MGIEKVAAFVTRDSESGETNSPELLVFRHGNPLAGIQVPAGTVEIGESPQDAVLREVAEEAGLVDLLLVGEPLRTSLELGADEWYLDLNSGGREAMSAHDLASPHVRIAGESGTEVLLNSKLSSGAPYEFWASRTVITRDVRRWLFHLIAGQDSEDRWERAFDTHQSWSFYWVPVTDDPGLEPTQQLWFELMRPRLLSGP